MIFEAATNFTGHVGLLYLAKVGDEITTRTLCFLFRAGKILLGQRKRGMGKGKFVGVGGRDESGESIREATIKEMVEEVGCKPSKLENAATVTFLFPYYEKKIDTDRIGGTT